MNRLRVTYNLWVGGFSQYVIINGVALFICYEEVGEDPCSLYGSEPSKHALDHWVGIADLAEAELLILSVVPRAVMPVFPGEGPGAGPATGAHKMVEHQERVKEVYSKSLKEAADDVTEAYPGIKVETRLQMGKPSSSIVEQAENEAVDLIVVGSSGLGGITGWALGSTSRRVVESCTAPVLVVK